MSMEDNRFMWYPAKQYVICAVCGCLVVAIAGAEIASARCHGEGCHEVDAQHITLLNFRQRIISFLRQVL